MRKDMFKKLVERPRGGIRQAPRIKLRRDPLPDRTKAGVRRFAQEQTCHTKWLSENFAPLRRYLWKQRGRPWSKVFSEICATIDTRSTVKQHIREHIDDFIVTQVTYAPDGTLVAHDRRGPPTPLHRCYRSLYVHPKGGIIKDVDTLRRKMGLPATGCR